MTSSGLRALLRAIRGPFLVLTPVSIALGLATAIATGATIAPVDISLVLTGALLAHIGVNTVNEYCDFRSGLDNYTIRTPFSGGSGALIEQPDMAGGVRNIAITALAATVAIGIYFAYRLGLPMILLGLTGLAIILSYTQWLNRHPIMCLIAPGLGFGPLMVPGTHLVLTGTISTRALAVSLVPFFLVSNLLLLNQFPDIGADKRVGRRHFPIVYGVNKSLWVYRVFVLGAGAVIISGIFTGAYPEWCLVSLLPLSLAAVVSAGAERYSADTQKLIPYLGMNVAVTLLTSASLALGIIYG